MQKRKKFVTATVSNKAGEIFDLDGYAAVGMAGSSLVPLTLDDTIQIPFGSELMLMPDRNPLLYNIKNHRIEILTKRILTLPTNRFFRWLHLTLPDMSSLL